MPKKLGRPFKEGEKKIVRTYTVQPELYDRVSKQLARNDRTVTSLIISAFNNYLG